MNLGIMIAVIVGTLFSGVEAMAEPLKVVATFGILADMVKQVGGEDVTVTTLVGPNGDVHVYEPTPTDAKAVAEAGLVVENGLGMEGWIGRLAEAVRYQGVVVVASKGVKPRRMAKDERVVIDPHAWQDLANGRLYVANIAAGLEAANPARATAYRSRAANFVAKLTVLETWVRKEIGMVPKEKRIVITSHDAFGYFGDAYGVTFLAPQSVSTESDVTARDLARLVIQIRTTRIKAVFMENMSNPRMIEQLARESGAVVGGTLYVDMLSSPDGPAADYVAMFRHNVRLLNEGMWRN